MDHIHLQHTLPQVFAGRDTVISQVWHQDIVFDKGKRYLIEASSGTGKSSLCSYIYGYRRDYQGIISFDGRNIRSFSVGEWADVRKHSLSILFQELRIFPELTALENVLLKNRLTNHKKKKEILALFEATGIPDKTDFIFLDEPISHLDNDNSAIMSRLLMEEAGKQGAGIIVTSIGKHLELEYDETFRL